MSLLDELKKWTHPYEDEDEEYDDFEEPVRQNAFEDRKLKVEDRRNKVVNIHATTQLKVVLVKPERFEKFWAYYPRHEDRVSAVREWDRLKPGDELIDAIARALLWQTKEPDWPVPYACRYLRNQRWTDEPPRPRAQGRPAAQQMTGWHMAIVDGEEVLVPDESG